jgi:hypothetical protein
MYYTFGIEIDGRFDFWNDSSIHHLQMLRRSRTRFFFCNNDAHEQKDIIKLLLLFTLILKFFMVFLQKVNVVKRFKKSK